MTPELSLNEIELTVRKAAVACGWPHGLAEEFGRSALWASEHGLNAVCDLLALAKPGPATAEPRQEGSRLVFPEGAAALVSALDCVAGTSVDEVTIPATGSLRGTAAFAGAAARSYGLEFEALRGGFTLFAVGPAHCHLPGRAAATNGTITLLAREARQPLVRNVMENMSSFNADCWAEAVALAEKTLVPETDASRERGAGAGLSDND